MPIPLEEMQQDYDDTLSDIDALDKICEGLNTFLTITGGEERGRYRIDQLRYTKMRTDAILLRDHMLELAEEWGYELEEDDG